MSVRQRIGTSFSEWWVITTSLFCSRIGADPHPYKFNNDCRIILPPSEEIKTIKVTKSKAAENIAAGESIANDPNVSHRVQSPNPGDIVKVLNALKK